MNNRAGTNRNFVRRFGMIGAKEPDDATVAKNRASLTLSSISCCLALILRRLSTRTGRQ